jgi:hypothetical protein
MCVVGPVTPYGVYWHAMRIEILQLNPQCLRLDREATWFISVLSKRSDGNKHDWSVKINAAEY